MKKKFIVSIIVLICVLSLNGQTETLVDLIKQLKDLEEHKITLLGQIEEVKLRELQSDIQMIGLPAILEGEKVISHSAISLVYSETHEQAKWVAHIITPDILKGQVSRSNDFRTDPKVKSGTAVEVDYFLKEVGSDGAFIYDGFGYDRGHLAPSADFRWSKKALSESYFYSNISPQVADFNRGKWAELEGAMRSYIYRNSDTKLFVCTGGHLRSDLSVIERGINKVSIPNAFWKVVIDVKNRRGVGFLMNNQKLDYPLANYIKSIDEIEKLTGIDFFVGLDDELEIEIEKQKIAEDWLFDSGIGDAEPIAMSKLPPRHYNTLVAAKTLGSGNKITVCGKVVSTRRSRKGNIMMNIDKQFPNQIFTVFIRKEDILNFSYNPEIDLKGQTVYIEGKVERVLDTAGIFLKKEENLKILDREVKGLLDR